MVPPFSRLGARCGSALAGTVAGMVRTQNTPRPNTAATTARMKSLRSIGVFLQAILEHDLTKMSQVGLQIFHVYRISHGEPIPTSPENAPAGRRPKSFRAARSV